MTRRREFIIQISAGSAALLAGRVALALVVWFASAAGPARLCAGLALLAPHRGGQERRAL